MSFSMSGENEKRGQMDYKEFVENVVSLLQERMGTAYEIKVTNVVKNNDIRLTGVIMMTEADRVSPTIYLEEPYQQYCGGCALPRVVDRILALYEAQMCKIDLDVDFFREFASVKDRIFHKIINYEKNRKLLEDIPHFRWNDLAVVFYHELEEKILGKATILIHNNHMTMWGQTADTLYRTAQHNMKCRKPELLVPMQRMIKEMTGVRVEEAEGIRLYVLTNQDKMYGASAMLYSVKMKELAENLQSDLLILPSSVHEVLLLPDDREGQYDSYRRMVQEVNTTQVEPEEILSFNLYRYSRKKEEVEEIIV